MLQLLDFSAQSSCDSPIKHPHCQRSQSADGPIFGSHDSEFVISSLLVSLAIEEQADQHVTFGGPLRVFIIQFSDAMSASCILRTSFPLPIE
jgi:hypothetical protein